MPIMESLRALIRAIGVHEKEVMRMSDENQFTLSFLLKQLKHKQQMMESEKSNAAAISTTEVSPTDVAVDQPNTEIGVSEEPNNAIDEGGNDKKKSKKRKSVNSEDAVKVVEATVEVVSSPKQEKSKKKKVEMVSAEPEDLQQLAAINEVSHSKVNTTTKKSSEVESTTPVKVAMTPTSSSKNKNDTDSTPTNDVFSSPSGVIKNSVTKKRISFGKDQVKYISPLIRNRKTFKQ